MALFFTRGVSLEHWVSSGLFYREKTIYEQHIKKNNFQKIYWLTYGVNDADIANKLKETGDLEKKIEVLPMPKKYNTKVGIFFYTFKMVNIYWKQLRECDVKKSNQMDGAWAAYYAKKKFGGIFSLRTGYTISTFLDNAGKAIVLKKWIFHKIEKFLYKRADVAFVSSEHDKKTVCEEYGIKSSRVEILRNYIDTKVFYNQKLADAKNEFVFVGRLNQQKNLYNTIRAVNRADYSLDIYGNGELKNDLELYIQKNKFNCRLMGFVANFDLADILNNYRYFILASNIEGMPKSLLEAMACGRLCIGTDVEGINELIVDGKTGILAETTTEEAIYHAILRLNDIEDKEFISNSAEQLINRKFSIESILDIEMRMYKDYGL